ncbi:MAG: phenylalanine--tRNA ligase subunit beta [Cellvibrionales bacterium]|jgi:phenylalanyl-tRNA synthetase beta chain|nr:phenylalanine--tRNA ligase subunit beta [Cellvibrionales bacterium]
MKFNKKLLEDHVDCSGLSAQQLADTITMAGLEVDAVTPVAPPFSGVVIGEIVAIEQHPDADKLRVCQVAGHPDGELKQVVCGAANARLGLKIPFATLGAELPSVKIKQAKLRGVESCGMLCAEQELGLADSSEGLWELPADAPVGACIREYLQLDDHIIEVDLTPNRGDCLGMLGLAREVAALTGCNKKVFEINKIEDKSQAITSVKLSAPAHCARYAGRVIQNINSGCVTPLWMVERLRRAGVRCIDPVVDVTNYVLLELGQPMHAFDLDKVEGGIEVRLARADETLVLLDGQTVTLKPDSLLIADAKKPLALAGIMGGAESAVSAETRSVLLESAWFNPVSMAGKARQYGLHTDASHRFERGVDFNIQLQAIELATKLLLDIVGGEAGPIVHVVSEELLPESASVKLTRKLLAQYLGVELPETEVLTILARLGFDPVTEADGWTVQAPSWRYDIAIEQDLIEEVARVYGYNRLPSRAIKADLNLVGVPETSLAADVPAAVLVARGYREVISYSFIAPELQAMFEPEQVSVSVRNPISADMSAMRASLIPSLVSTLQYNLNRQQDRARFFESGLRFRLEGGRLEQQPVLAGLLYGNRQPESWHGGSADKIDFYDLKGDVQALLARTGRASDFSFAPAQHPALHPGQTAAIVAAGRQVGLIGALHPELLRKLDIPGTVLVFEMEREALLAARQPAFAAVSRFPEVRRDLAVVVDRALPVSVLCDTVRTAAGDCLINLKVFDVYVGEHIESTRKSVALGLTFQQASRTLNEVEIVEWVDAVIAAVGREHGATLRN